jgi:lipid-A-disaccharide synthase
MRAYVDRVLALLPFEPEAYVRLGGPPCVYVGHPLIERLRMLRPNEDETRRRDAEPPIIVVLPGSRRSEIRRLMKDFGGALNALQEQIGPFLPVLPTLPHIEDEVRARAALWPLVPRVVLGEGAKFEAFRTARAALAASGTATLELALAGVPAVGAYKVSRVEEQLKYLIKTPSILLPNLILGEPAIPEKLQRDCAPAALGAALADIVRDGATRRAQIEALGRLDQRMRLPDGGAPSAHAARAVLATVATRNIRALPQYSSRIESQVR